MKKVKCDICGKKSSILKDDMKVIGKPKNRMKLEELQANNTRLGDNRVFEKRLCKNCLK